MKLIVKRDQDKAFLGGINFKLFCKVELTPEEQQLVNKYKLQNEVLTAKRDGSPDLTVNDLLRGVEEKLKSVDVLINNEEAIKVACKSFKDLLIVSASFGGQEVIEI